MPRAPTPRTSPLDFSPIGCSEAGVEALFANAARFGLTPTDVRGVWQEVCRAVAGWRAAADAAGIPSDEQDAFAPVLDRWPPA